MKGTTVVRTAHTRRGRGRIVTNGLPRSAFSSMEKTMSAPLFTAIRGTRAPGLTCTSANLSDVLGSVVTH